MDKSDQMSLTFGESLRDEGVELVSNNNADWLEEVREYARRVCERQGSVTSDHLRKWADENNSHPKHPNAWGAVFRGRGWYSGELTKSFYRSNHARRIFVWRWREPKGLSI